MFLLQQVMATKVKGAGPDDSGTGAAGMASCLCALQGSSFFPALGRRSSVPLARLTRYYPRMANPPRPLLDERDLSGVPGFFLLRRSMSFGNGLGVVVSQCI